MEIKQHPEMPTFISKIKPTQLANLQSKCNILERANDELEREITKIRREIHSRELAETRDYASQVPEDFIAELTEVVTLS